MTATRLIKAALAEDIHTGDVTHAAKPAEFDDALEMIKRTKLDVHYSPGEHDIADAKGGLHTSDPAQKEMFPKPTTIHNRKDS